MKLLFLLLFSLMATPSIELTGYELFSPTGANVHIRLNESGLQKPLKACVAGRDIVFILPNESWPKGNYTIVCSVNVDTVDLNR